MNILKQFDVGRLRITSRDKPDWDPQSILTLGTQSDLTL